MGAPTISQNETRSLWFYAHPLLVTVATALVGGMIVWALGGSTGGYFAVGVLAAIAGGYLVSRRMISESSRQPLAEADSEISDPPTSSSEVSSVSDASSSGPVLVALVGHSRSGKTQIADWVTAHHPDWAGASCGKYVLAEAKQRGLPLGERDLTDKLGGELVRGLGPGGFIDKVIASAQIPEAASLILIDDVYHEDVWQALKERWGPAIAVRVKSRDAEDVDVSFLDQEATRLINDVHPILEITGTTGQDPDKSGLELIEKVTARLAAAG